jgi:ribosomal protein S18 acetylase RimI-like enzyme
MDAQVLKAQLDDAGVIALLGRITFAETFGYLFVDHQDDLLAYLDRTFDVGKIRRSMDDPRNSYWLGFADGLPVGYAKLKYPSITSSLEGKDAAQLQKIYVLKDFLGRGIGKCLLQIVVDHAVNRQIENLWLDVLKENTRAVLFYEREGFDALGEDTYTIGAQTFAFHLMMRRVKSPTA